jgi:competence protein ComEA
MSFFHFTSSERIGIIALIIISTGIIYYRTTQNQNISKNIPNIGTKQHVKKQFSYYKKTIKSFSKKKYNCFKFDPNTLSLNDFLKMGLSEKQANVIIRYREKGGKFKTADDFAKIYSISAETHAIFKPFINIDTTLFISQKKNFLRYSKQSVILDINNATAEELIKLPHIGISRAHTIIAFREKIGGYFSINQLKELYGFSPFLVDSIKGMFSIDTLNHRRININTAGISEMKSHPYFSYFTAKKIVDYRNTKGVLTTPSELIQNKIIDSLTYRKIVNYITIK